MNLKVKLEYKFAFVVDLSVQIFSYITIFINLLILMNKFNSLVGWNFYQILFLWDLNLFSYGISAIFFYNSTMSITNLVNTGEFDVLLTKPINPLSFLICKNLTMVFLAHIILSMCVFVYINVNIHIAWNVYKIVFFIFALVGSFLIQSSILLISGSISFWTIKSDAITNTLIYGLRNFIVYPITIYNKFIQIILTFIIPYAFITFYPSSYIFNKKEKVFFNGIDLLTLIVGIIMFLLAILVWKKGIKVYNSSGN